MTHTRRPIAIVGVSALFPGSSDATGFWRDILAGRDLLSDVPPSHWRIEDYYDPDPAAPDKTYAKRGGFLPKVDFDALGWGVPPSQLPATDTSQLLALIVAQQVLQDAARGQFEAMDRSRISVILGVTSAQELLFSMVSRLQRPVWLRALREAGIAEDQVQQACEKIAAQYVPWQEASFPGLLGNVVALVPATQVPRTEQHPVQFDGLQPGSTPQPAAKTTRVSRTNLMRPQNVPPPAPLRP